MLKIKDKLIWWFITTGYVLSANNSTGPTCPIPLGIEKGRPSPKIGCTDNALSADFETSLDKWTGNIAAKEELSKVDHDSQYMRVYDRIAAWQGPILDLTVLKDCLSPNIAYILTIDLRLRKADGETDCFASEGMANCPKIVWNHMTRMEKLRVWTLNTVGSDIYKKDDEWFTWRTDFMLLDSYLEISDIFQAMAINGPEPGVEMHMDNLKIYLPAESHFPDPEAACDELIINGGADASDTLAFPFKSLILKEELQIKKDKSGNNYYHMEDRSQDWSGPAFTLDPDCLREDSEFEFNARIWIHDEAAKASRIIMKYFDENKKSKFVTIAMCDKSSESIGWVDCPGKLTFTAKYVKGPYALSWMTHQTTAPTDWDDMKLTAIAGKCGKAPEVVLSADGTVNVTASIAKQEAKAAKLAFDPMAAPVATGDDTKKVNADGSYAGTCKDEDFNRDVELGDLSFWKEFGAATFALDESTGDGSTSKAAIKVTKRKTFWSSVSNFIEPKCLEVGKAYRAQARIKLERDGKPYDCVPGKYWGPKSWQPITCPVLAIRARAGTKWYDTDVGKVYKWNSGEWNDVFGVFVVTDDMVKAETVEAWFTKFHQDTDIIIDNLSIQPETGYGCDENNIHNYDFRYLDSRSWEKYWSGSIDMWDFKNDEGKDKKAAAYSGFRQWHEGIGQNIDPNCIDLESEYEVSVDVQIYDKDKTTVVNCDPEVNYIRKVKRGGCPWVVIADQKPRAFPKYTTVAAVNQTATWDNTTWNTITGTFKFDQYQVGSPRLWIQVANGRPGETIIVNKLVLKKAGAVINVAAEATVALGSPTPVPITEVGDGDCTRDVKINVDAEIDPNIELVVTNGDKSVTAKIPSSFISIDDNLDTHWYVARRFFSFSLADGDWKGSFTLNGVDASSVFSVVIIGGKPSCAGYMKSFLIEETKNVCTEVIRNGDFEATNDVKMSQWYHSGCGLNFTEGVIGKALATQGRTSIGHGLIQFLDTSCMKLDQSYDINAKIKLVKTGSNETVTCDPELRTLGSERCPRASIRASKDGNPLSYAYGIANTLGPFKENDWNYMFGSFVINDDMSKADQVAFYIDGVAEGVEIIIDDVSIKPSPVIEGTCLDNWNFEVGDSRKWSCTGKSTCGLQMVQPGHGGDPNGKPTYALSTTRRDATTWGIAQVLDKDCISVGDMVELTAYVKLLDYNGFDQTCDPYIFYQGLSTFCPVMILQDAKRNNKREVVSSVAGPYKDGDWNLMYGYTTITETMKNDWHNIELFVGWGGKNKNIVIDDVVIKPTTAAAAKKTDCNQLVKNGDAESGDARYWYIKGAGNFGKIEVNDGGAGGSSKYFAHTGVRSKVNMGMWQELDKSCMALNSKWKLSSMFKYFDAAGNAVVCANPGQMCPKWRIEGFNGSGAKLKGAIYNNEKTKAGQWKANDWNAYEATFTMTQEFFDRERIFIYILAPEKHSYHVDDIKVEPIE